MGRQSHRRKRISMCQQTEQSNHWMGFVERKRFYCSTSASPPLNATVSWVVGEGWMGGQMDGRTDRPSTSTPPPPPPSFLQQDTRPSFYSVANCVVYSLLITFVRHIFRSCKTFLVVVVDSWWWHLCTYGQHCLFSKWKWLVIAVKSLPQLASTGSLSSMKPLFCPSLRRSCLSVPSR